MVDWDEFALLDLWIHIPKDHIIDYNTEFSGISSDTLDALPPDSVVSFEEAQARVIRLLGSFPQVIVVGHSLENDLQALRVGLSRSNNRSHIHSS